MVLLKSPPVSAISFDSLPTSTRPLEIRTQKPPIELPAGSELQIESIEDLPDGDPGLASATKL